jgi:hypothetical protein
VLADPVLADPVLADPALGDWYLVDPPWATSLSYSDNSVMNI